jgi:drug/metabolite transporter (DMT)-like permease
MIVTACLLAVISAVALAVGTHLQHRGVALAAHGSAPDEHSGTGRVPSFLACLRTPVWVLGAGSVVIATVLNVLALAMAPVALVQPMGVISLVVAAIISTRSSGLRFRGPLLAGIVACVAGIVVFVVGSSTVSRHGTLSDDAAWALAGLLAFAAVAAAVVLGRRRGHLIRVAVSGVAFGLVAVSVHAVAPVLGRTLLHLPLPGTGTVPGLPVTVLLVALIAVLAATGSWLVQTAYASGPPETVLAGLTVLDPMIAVLVGAALLHEYTLPAPTITLLLVVSAVVATVGIGTVVRHHPGVVGHRSGMTAPPTSADRAPDGFHAHPQAHDETARIARG